MVLSETEKYIRSGLNCLKDRIYQHLYSVQEVRMLPLAYGQRERVLESTKGWEVFSCQQTWGGPDRHFCFAAVLPMPEAAGGKEIVLRLNTGADDIWNTDNPQFLAYVNGTLRCAMDMNHHEVVVSSCARAGETADVRLYAYSNSKTCTNFLHLDVLAFSRQIEQGYYDLCVPFEAAFLLRDDDDRKTWMYQVLAEAVSRMDFRNISDGQFLESLEQARTLVRAQLIGTDRGDGNGPDGPEVYSVGHTHIDVAWKWPVRQTREKAVRSFQTVLSLMDEYPEYRFMSSQPQLYQFVKEECPSLLAQIKERVAEGRWEPEGGMWLEADCNITSGESFIRQILYGKKFFREEFGKGDNVVLWLPDVFGYSAALPQIMKKTGLNYFMTTKIGWNEKNKFPYDTMIWEGIDGSQVLSHFITTRDYRPYPELDRRKDISTTYNGMEDPSQIMGTWQRYQNRDISRKVLTCYGYGDGGGGTTREMIEKGKRLAEGICGCPRVRFAGVREFFEDLEQELSGKKVPKWSGELYLEFHRGTYTSMAENKKQNRACEFLLQQTEWMAAKAWQYGGRSYPADRLERAWKLLMLNQFHDILPGTCIEEVYTQTDMEYEEIRRICGEIQAQSRETLLPFLGISKQREANGDGERAACVTLWNPLSFSVSELTELPGAGWKLGTGETPATQPTYDGNTLLFAADIPAKGVLTIPAALSARESDAQKTVEPQPVRASVISLDTPFYQAEIQADGTISRLYDKEYDREVFLPGQAGNRLRIFDDRPLEYDAWNIDEEYTRKSWEPESAAEAELLEQGPLRYVVKISRTYLSSSIVQYLTFYGASRRIDFRTELDWQEHQQLLKAEFPFDIMSRSLRCEIQYGNVERPTHRNTSWDQARFEMCMHKWVDLSENGYGAALLNDSRFGCSAEDSTVSLTLLKSGIFPSPNADIGPHTLTYSLYPHGGDFRDGRVIQAAYALNCPPKQIWGTTKELAETRHTDFFLDAENIFVDVEKGAEDQKGIVVRMYEAYGRRTKAHWMSGIGDGVRVWECDMLEQKERELPVSDGQVESLFAPYEIKTFYLEWARQ